VPVGNIEVTGAPIGYDDTGTGRAVVLVHAGIADRRMWRWQLGGLARAGYRAIAMDLHGYGESGVPTGPFAHHDDVVALLDQLGIRRAALVGCSFGGRVVIDTALAHPDRVTGLALFGSVVSGHVWSAGFHELWRQHLGTVDPGDLTATAEAEVRLWVVGPDREPADLDPGLLAHCVAMDRRALAGEALLDAADVRDLDPPAAGRLAGLRVPALVTAGAYDLPDIRLLADRLAAQVPAGIRLPDIADAAHLLPLERPQPVNHALLDLLADLRWDTTPE
jgi:pimeloyl-ACP methyl ester carboxylesterase